MDCLTDTHCLTNIFETLNQLAATLDFFGLLLFGDVWSPIGPGIEARTEWFAGIFNKVLFGDPAGCTQFAMLEIAHA